jgi:hypothetical protein
MIECPRCYTKIPVHANRLPPWCPQCGGELKTLAAASPGAGSPGPSGPREQPMDPAAVRQMVEDVVGRDPAKGPNVSRAYRHRGCGEVTVVSGDDLVLLECPFRPVESTVCCRCEGYVPLDSVEWADSGELISTYRRRVKASVPFLRRLFLYTLGNAYQGAVNLHLDSKGRPLPPEG